MQRLICLVIAGGLGLAAFGYDVHTKALTPIEEEARPAGSPMAFVRDGKIDFAIVADLKTEGTIGAKSDFSVRPAVRELTNAFAQQRVRASYTPPVYAAAKLSADETIVVDGVADAAWGKADAMPLVNPTDPTKKTDWPTTVRMRWDGKGLYLLATADWEALVTPDEDIWKENDMIELLFCPGLGKEVAYQFAWDFSSRLSAKYQRFLPIVQPANTNWKPAGVTSKATYGGGKWTFEAFVPFSAVEDVGTPKVGDAWNVNVVRDKSAKGLAAFRTLDSVSSSFTMGNNHRREMFGIIRFAKEK